MRRYDATDFGTPVSAFDVVRAGNGARIAHHRRRATTSSSPTSPTTSTWSKCSRRRKAVAQAEDKPRVHRRAPHAQLPGHRDPRGAAAAGGRQRPEHRGERLRAGQRHAAPAERALGPGARHRAAHQGPRQAPARTTSSSSRRRRSWPPARRRSWPRARTSQELAPLRSEYPAGELRQGRGHGGADQVAGRLAALRQRGTRRRRRAHQHAAAAGHRRPARRHPPPGGDARHPDPPGADRSAHRDRER